MTEGCASVGLDFGAGTQSAGVLTEGLQLLYIPIDLKKWVYSARSGQWVENVVFDLSKVSGCYCCGLRKIRLDFTLLVSLCLVSQCCSVLDCSHSTMCLELQKRGAS